MREPKTMIVVGQRGAGKSTWIAKFVKKYHGNVIVYKHLINASDKAFEFLTTKKISNLRQGNSPDGFVKCKMIGQSEKDFDDFSKWVISAEGFRNGLLVVDDMVNFVRDRPKNAANTLLSGSRHLGCDLIMVYHGLAVIPIEIFNYSDMVVLFNQKGNPAYKKTKIAAYDSLMAGAELARSNYLRAATKYKPVIVNL